MTKKSLLACLLFLFVSPAIFAQSVPAAEGGRRSIWAGAEVSAFNPDWGCTSGNAPLTCWDYQLYGVGAFSDVNRLLGPIGFEGEAHWMPWHGRSGMSQSSYLVGPRFQVLAGHRASLNVKALAGGGVFHPARGGPWQGWAAYAPGATLGYRMSPRLLVRVDYEYQIWPGFVGVNGANGLTPNGFSVGASYRLFH